MGDYFRSGNREAKRQRGKEAKRHGRGREPSLKNGIKNERGALL
jgi:hypothetical protein